MFLFYRVFSYLWMIGSYFCFHFNGLSPIFEVFLLFRKFTCKFCSYFYKFFPLFFRSFVPIFISFFPIFLLFCFYFVIIFMGFTFSRVEVFVLFRSSHVSVVPILRSYFPIYEWFVPIFVIILMGYHLFLRYFFFPEVHL